MLANDPDGDVFIVFLFHVAHYFSSNVYLSRLGDVRRRRGRGLRLIGQGQTPVDTDYLRSFATKTTARYSCTASCSKLLTSRRIRVDSSALGSLWVIENTKARFRAGSA